jgi:hypothetical protein
LLSCIDTPTEALAFLCLELAFNFHSVFFAHFQSDSLLELIFLKHRSSDPGQSDAAFHILSDFSLSSDGFLDELITSDCLIECGRPRSRLISAACLPFSAPESAAAFLTCSVHSRQFCSQRPRNELHMDRERFRMASMQIPPLPQIWRCFCRSSRLSFCCAVAVDHQTAFSLPIGLCIALSVFHPIGIH